MNILIYLYHIKAPTEKKLFHCINCNRVLFAYNAHNVIISNVMGGKDLFEPGEMWIEVKCHSCKTTHKVLFQ